jgi:hypothetical protein
VTLAECAFGGGGIGLTADVLPVHAAAAEWSSAVTLFSESASRVVVSVLPPQVDGFMSRAKALGVPARRIGTTGGARIVVSIRGRSVIDIAVAEAEAIWDRALENHFKQRVA